MTSRGEQGTLLDRLYYSVLAEFHETPLARVRLLLKPQYEIKPYHQGAPYLVSGQS